MATMIRTKINFELHLLVAVSLIEWECIKFAFPCFSDILSWNINFTPILLRDYFTDPGQ